MRADLRLRLREITKSVSTAKKGVTGVTGVTARVSHPLSHLAVTPSSPQKAQRIQRVTPVTPRHTLENEGRDLRHTSAGVTDRVTEGVTGGGVAMEDWLAHFNERAGIMEFDGGLDRVEAERRAFSETVAAFGTRPGELHYE